MHHSLNSQYAECDCQQCRNQKIILSNKSRERYENHDVIELAKQAFNKVYARKKYSPNDLLEVPEFRAVVDKIAGVFSSAIPHETPEEMKAYLEKDAFIFSGLKTHAQLTEARSFLKDEKGNIRPYYQFEREILKLNEKYNKNYLEAEYQFAISSSQSAANWANLSNNTDRYWLEYRTAGDEKVRASHAQLNGICLPKNDPFWQEFYPPNGWRCRCIAVEVLAKEKTPSDSKKSILEGQKATSQIGTTGKNKLAMFRFNPGQEKKIFPPNNSYMPKHCSNGKNTLTGFAKVFLSLEDERCKALQNIEKEATKSLQAKLREKYLNEMEHLLKKAVYKTVEEKEMKIRFTKKGNKHLYSDTFGRAKFDKEELKNIDQKLKNAEFIKSSELSKQRKDNIVKFYYFKDKDRGLYYNVAEEILVKGDGHIKEIYFLYSITNKIK